MMLKFRMLVAGVVMLGMLVFSRTGFGGSARVERLPDLVSVAQWRMDADAQAALREAPEWVLVDLPSKEGVKSRILLVAPIAIPSWADGFTFRLGSEGARGKFDFKLIVWDEAGGEQLIPLTSTELFDATRLSMSNPKHRDRVLRLRALLGEGGGKRWIGGIEAAGHDEQSGPPVHLFWRDFALTRVSPKTSEFYYTLDNQESYGELEPLPTMALAQLLPGSGKRIEVRWEARDDYAGQPFISGTACYLLDPKNAPYPLQMAKPIELPLRERGTYWIYAQAASYTADASMPSTLREREFRLDVVRGLDPLPHKDVVENRAIQIAPERHSSIDSETEPLRISVKFAPGKSGAYRVKALRFATGEEAFSAEGALSPGGAEVLVDLDGAAGGVYRIQAERLQEGKLVERSVRLVASRKAAGAAGQVPEGIVSGKKLLAGDDPLFFLCPRIKESNRNDLRARWEELKAFMDQAGEVSNIVELPVEWMRVEPLPGVFDWGEVDRVMEYAREKGLRVQLWPEVVGREPEWLPGEFTQNEAGEVFGHNRYLFHGKRLDYWHAGAVRNAALSFISTLVERYRGHPEVLGYFFITEHPSEAPYIGWRDGFNYQAIEHFRQNCRSRWSNLEELNRRWGTHFDSWDAISVPFANASPRFRLDWLEFRRDAVGDLLVEVAQTIRKLDPVRLITIYNDGLDAEHLGILDRMGGILTANGGSQNPELSSVFVMGRALSGLQERTEEITPGRWSALSPVQLDSSLFSMMSGGGRNAHCKMYIDADQRFSDLRRAPYSLDRYEKFIPIWRELRKADPLPYQAYLLDDRNGRLAVTQTTYYGGGESAANLLSFQSHLLTPAVPIEIASGGKLVLLTMARCKAFERGTMEALEKYVADGGTVLMTADAGRRCPDLNGEDWVLLRHFGFVAPTGEPRRRALPALPIPGDVFSHETAPFLLQDVWEPAPDDGATILAKGDKGEVRVTVKPFGKGRVVVCWASGLVPPLAGPDQQGRPFLEDVARWAGVQIKARSDSPRLWTNLLKHRDAPVYYGLVYGSIWREKPAIVAGTVFWDLPAGHYAVQEMILGISVGSFSAEALRDAGIGVKLNPNAVAIYRISRLPQ